MERILIILLTSTVILIASPAFAQNRVLSLDGDGDYVEMMDSELLNDIGPQVTLELWIRPTGFPQQWISLISKVDEDVAFTYNTRSYIMHLNSSGFIHLSSALSGQSGRELWTADGMILLNKWYHIAGVIDTINHVMSIFINGTEVESGEFVGDIYISKLPLTIGKSDEHKPMELNFQGQMDEVRIWNTARSQKEIRQTMHSKLSGNEQGLVAYWDLGSPSMRKEKEGTERKEEGGEKWDVMDSSGNGIHGKLAGDAKIVSAELPSPDDLDEIFMPSILTGAITDESGNPLSKASIRLERNGARIAQVETDVSGKYRISIVDHDGGLYDLSARKDDLGTWEMGFRLVGWEQTINLTLKDAVSISGTVRMLDDITPHVAVPVEALLNGEKVAGTLTDEKGKYQFVNLRPGSYELRCQVLNGYAYYGEDKPVKLQVQPDKHLRDVDFNIAAFKKGIFRTYGPMDGLPGHAVNDIYCDKDGVMLFATRKGLSRYDGQNFVNLTTEDGLVHNEIYAIYEDVDGAIWMGTKGGISRYDGKNFTNFTTEDGLVHDYVRAIHQDSQGNMWFGTGWIDARGGGISRYDGEEFTNFTMEDGLPFDTVCSIDETPDGVLWFGAIYLGIATYDGTKLSPPIHPGDRAERNGILDICMASDGMIWLGTWDGLCRYDGEEFKFFTMEDGLPHNFVYDIAEDKEGVLWLATGQWANSGGGLCRYDGKTFVNFTIEDGLGSNILHTVECAPDGTIWAGCDGGGVSHYDSSGILNLSTRDGLPNNWVNTVHIDKDGTIWFGLKGGKVSRYDGHRFHDYTVGSGTMTEMIWDIHRDPDGDLWLGTWEGGAFRYSGRDFVSVPELSNQRIMSIYSDYEGRLWFGTWMGGVSRYDDGKLTTFTKEDGLAGNIVQTIEQDTKGNLWFGTRNSGLSRYDGKEFKNFGIEDGLPANWVSDIYSGPDGKMWFGTTNEGAIYDGKATSSFSMYDGFPESDIGLIYNTSDGDMWFGSTGRGAFRYDGSAWISLDTRDGLSGNAIGDMEEDADGYIWFGTTEGMTRYKPVTTPPKVRIVSVNSAPVEPDKIYDFRKDYRIKISYSAIDFRTIPEKRQYRIRVKGIDQDWRKPTRDSEFEWEPEKAGEFTFEVQAIDRDLNYSEPAILSFNISPLPFYQTDTFLILVIIAGSLSLLAATFLGVQRWRLAHNEKVRIQNELQDARQMQMSLLPETAPVIEGISIKGKSLTANTVGGDFFDYLRLPDGRIGIVVADVSGKGLKAAMNATMTNGMLHEVVKVESSSGRILSELNAGLCPLMEKQMFTALSFAIIDENAGVIQWSNAAQPKPLIKGKDGAHEAEENGELPLGMMPDVTYPDHELRLGQGEMVIFYTDGIIEAENEKGEIYGTERLVKLVGALDPELDAEGVMDAIFEGVRDFIGDARQYDDMTIVAVKKV